MMRAADSFAAPLYPEQYWSAGRVTVVIRKSFRQTIASLFSSRPPRQRATLPLKKVWICASVIVLLFVNTASLMRLPGVKPVRLLFAIPVSTGAAEAFAAAATGDVTVA